MFAKALQKVCKGWGTVIFYSNRIVGFLKVYETDKKQGANFKNRSCFSINYMVAEIDSTKTHTFCHFSRILI